MIHKHHIIPLHAGGPDDPSNIIELTVEEHANAHKELYEKYDNEYDRIAYLGLSGQINMSEAKRLAQLEGRKRGGDIARANRNANGTSIGDWNRLTGNVKNISTEESCKKGGHLAGTLLVESGKWDQIRSLGSIAGGKVAMKILNGQKCKCLECELISTPAGIGNHQKATGHKGKEKLNASN